MPEVTEDLVPEYVDPFLEVPPGNIAIVGDVDLERDLFNKITLLVVGLGNAEVVVFSLAQM